MNKDIQWAYTYLNDMGFKNRANRLLNAYNKAKKEVFDDIEKLSRPLAGDFGETPIYKEYQELKKKHLNTSNTEKVDK